MKLLEYLESAVLLEGGAAIKSSSKVTQAEARALIPDLLVKVMKVLKLPKAKIKAIGSAGNKPNADDIRLSRVISSFSFYQSQQWLMD